MTNYYGLFSACVIFLGIVWLSLTCFCLVYYIRMAKKKIERLPPWRNKILNILRAFMYVGLFPLGLTCVLAIALVSLLRY